MSDAYVVGMDDDGWSDDSDPDLHSEALDEIDSAYIRKLSNPDIYPDLNVAIAELNGCVNWLLGKGYRCINCPTATACSAKARKEMTAVLDVIRKRRANYVRVEKVRGPGYNLGDPVPLYDDPGYDGLSANFPGRRIDPEPVIESAEEAVGVLSARATRQKRVGYKCRYFDAKESAAMRYLWSYTYLSSSKFKNVNRMIECTADNFPTKAADVPMLTFVQKKPNQPPPTLLGSCVTWWKTDGTPEGQWRMVTFVDMDGTRYDKKMMQFKSEIWPPHLHVRCAADTVFAPQATI